MTWCVTSDAVSNQESSCARESKKGCSSLANKECPFPGNGIVCRRRAVLADREGVTSRGNPEFDILTL